MKIVYSKNNILIRLTDEIWSHIIENHDELAGRIDEVLNTVAEPDIIVKGEGQELLAARKSDKRWIVVVYKETDDGDGFIITAFITSRISYLLKKEILWKKQ
ncbi:hypothetical protein HY357_03145 [Candidatus Roizmanbacteria bacterium]|nr:hypothetical protein [Candidatus Roizmanbacteria bacterium]